MALLTKSIGIITPLVLSIVVVVALRLILYNGRSPDSIIQEIGLQIVSYKTLEPDLYRTWASVRGGERV